MTDRNWKLKGVPRVLLATALFASAAVFAADSTEDDSVDTVPAGGTLVFNGLTAAGVQVTNEALLSYDVNGTQVDIAADPDSFLVDRRLDVNVTAEGSTKTAAVGTNAGLQYLVTNESNDEIDLQLVVVRQFVDAGTQAAAPATGTDRYDSTATLTVCIETVTVDGDCADEPMANQLGAGPIYTIPKATAVPGTPVNIAVQVPIAANAVRSEWDTWILAAGVTDPDDSDNRLLVDDNGRPVPGAGGVAPSPDSANVDNVFADAAAGDAVNFSTPVDLNTDELVSNGQAAAIEQLLVQAPNMTVAKGNALLGDPIVGFGVDLTRASATGGNYPLAAACATCTAEPKRIPGAVVQYTISVENVAGTNVATAQAVTLADALTSAIDFGLANTTLQCDGTPNLGVVAGSGTCQTTITAADWAGLLVTTCAGGGTATTSIVANTGLSGGISLGNCAPGDTASITYWTSLQ